MILNNVSKSVWPQTQLVRHSLSSGSFITSWNDAVTSATELIHASTAEQSEEISHKTFQRVTAGEAQV